METTVSEKVIWTGEPNERFDDGHLPEVNSNDCLPKILCVEGEVDVTCATTDFHNQFADCNLLKVENDYSLEVLLVDDAKGDAINATVNDGLFENAVMTDPVFKDLASEVYGPDELFAPDDTVFGDDRFDINSSSIEEVHDISTGVIHRISDEKRMVNSSNSNVFESKNKDDEELKVKFNLKPFSIQLSGSQILDFLRQRKKPKSLYTGSGFVKRKFVERCEVCGKIFRTKIGLCCHKKRECVEDTATE